MKALFSLLLPFAASMTLAQNGYDPDYDYFPEDSIVFRYCAGCPDSMGYSFPIDAPDSLVLPVFGKPDVALYFGPGSAYFMTYADRNTDTVAFYAYDLPEDSAFHKAGFIFVKYPGRMKLERHYFLPQSALHFGCYVVNAETTVEEIRDLFPLSYATALRNAKETGYLIPPGDDVFGIVLRTSPWDARYDGYPNPYMSLVFVKGKLAQVDYQTGT